MHQTNKASVIDLLSVSKMCNSNHTCSLYQELDHMFGIQNQTYHQDYPCILVSETCTPPHRFLLTTLSPVLSFLYSFTIISCINLRCILLSFSKKWWIDVWFFPFCNFLCSIFLGGVWNKLCWFVQAHCFLLYQQVRRCQVLSCLC